MKPLLPIPPHFQSKRATEVFFVPYQARATEAVAWAKAHNIAPTATDKKRVCLMIIDNQNTFCLPNGELFVGGRSGDGAVKDSIRVSEFIYKNLDRISEIAPTMDTHTAFQIFHQIFLVNDKGEHPGPATEISHADVVAGKWKVNPAAAYNLAIKKDPSTVKDTYLYLQRHLEYYTKTLESSGKYKLMIWPYHAMLGGAGHALVSIVEEAIFFHSIARASQPSIETKGQLTRTEYYSVLKPEVTVGFDGNPIGQRNTNFYKKLLSFDMVIVAGQAKSHCYAWTIDDLLNEILTQDKTLAKKVYLLDDCTSSVVIPGIVDFTQAAEDAMARFASNGMHVVKSTDQIESWPDSPLA